MYSPKIIASKATQVESAFPISLKEHSPTEVDEWVARIGSALDPNSSKDNPKLRRDLTLEEKNFITNEVFMTKISYPYWATRYAMIKGDKGGLVKMSFWESQELMLKVIGEMEEAGQPILIMNLKSRQVGSSTLSETVLCHKSMTQHGFNSLVAADEPNQSAFLFNMMLRVHDSLPFWLRPHIEHRVKGTELFFNDLDSAIFVDSGNKRIGGIGQGKALPLETRVWTPTGSTPLACVRVGDLVIGGTGEPTKVIGVYPQGRLPVWIVELSDGRSIQCSEDHLWAVQSAHHRHRGQPGKVVTTQQLAADLTRKNGSSKWFLPAHPVLNFPHITLPVDPYILGVLLGDGCLTIKSRVLFSTADQDLLNEVQRRLPPGLTIKKSSGDNYDYRISSSTQLRYNPVLTALREIGLHGHGAASKTIPKDYLLSSVEQRLDLLHGLMDTDGYVCKEDNSVEFYSISRGLVEGVRELVESLGGTARLKTKKTTHKPCYVLRIALHPEHNPFWLPRKATAYHPRTKYPPTRAVRAVYPSPDSAELPMACVKVAAADGLFQVAENITTHNTIHSGHLSEMATWIDPQMVEEDLIPAVLSGASPNMFFIMESTAKGYNHWRDWWLAAGKGKFHGFVQVFIPWWSIKEKYAASPTVGWEPSAEIKAVAATLNARGIELTRKQMYWWDRTYESYKESNRLNAFYAEYAGTPEEAFQLGGRSIFPVELIQRLRQHALARTSAWGAVYELQEKRVLRT
jgi:hypothetical protein